MKLARLAICLALALMTTVASAQTDSTFTYQGELNENGTPANGAFNMAFTLFDSANGGVVVGTPMSHGAVPNTKVSWLVTGVRQDPYAEANRIPVEEMKPTELRGLYRHPELYGRTPEFREDSIKLSAMQQERPESNEAVEQVTEHPNHQKSNQE